MARVSNTWVGWENIVMLAREKAAGVAFAPHVQPAAPACAPVLPVRQVQVAPPPPRASAAVQGGGVGRGAAGGQAEWPHCDLCRRLGLGGDMHKWELCFIDPKSRMYRPEVRQRKLLHARKLGIPIPPEIDIKDEAPQHNLISQAYQLVGLVGVDDE